jgi:hypothetical protein
MFRNKIRYLILLTSVGLLLILFNKYYIGMIFLTTLMMPFFLFGLLSYTYGKVRAELVSVIHIAGKGEKIPVTIQLSNPTIFPVTYVRLYITYKNAYSAQKFKKSIYASLDYRTNTSVIFHLASRYAGNMEITLEGIRIYDYMKLFSLKRKLKSEIKVAVLPDYYELAENETVSRSTPLTESDNYSPVKKGDDPSEVFEIRPYREGDRLQRVHWKLSRKQNQLMIKEFSDPVNCRELLFVNLNMISNDKLLFYMDAILEFALSLSYTLITNEHQHYIAWYDVEHGACRRIRITDEKDLYEAVDGLLHARPFVKKEDILSAYLSEFPHDHYCELYFISSVISVPNMAAFLEIKAYNKQMIYVREEMDELQSEENVEILQSYQEAGVSIWQMDAENIRNGMEQLSLSQ